MLRKYILLVLGILCATNGTIKSEFSNTETALAVAVAVGVGAATSFCYWMYQTVGAYKQYDFKNVLTKSLNVHRLCIDAATIGLVLVCLNKSRLKQDIDFEIFKAKHGSGARI